MSEARDNLRKAAILVASLDRHTADLLLEQMPAQQAQAVRDAVVALGETSLVEQRDVIEEFFQIGPFTGPLDDGGVELDASLARRLALDADRPLVGAAAPPFGFLHQAPGAMLAPLLTRERPQTVAVILSHLPPEQAAAVLSALPPQSQREVASRLVDLDETDPELVREIERGLASWFAGNRQLQERRAAGADALRGILAAADGRTRRNLLAHLSPHDERFADEPLPPVDPLPPVTFAGLVELDDQSLGEVLRLAEAEVLVLALAGAEERLVARVCEQLSPEGAKMLRYGLAHLGPTRLSDVDAAQQQLAELAAYGAARRGVTRRLSLAA
jgi:flagellar motor switch protein FliG